VERAGCVVVAPSATALDRALTVTGAGLRGVAPTVAVSERSAPAVAAALRAGGVSLAQEEAVAVSAAEPALPTAAEDAVGPRAVRVLLERAVAEQRQVRLRYFASSRGGAPTDRVVDPWTFGDDLLRGWCHLRLGERTFAVDRVGHARLLPTPVEHREGAG
jgi:predicted DNA-binding transcriptional regulator YafY